MTKRVYFKGGSLSLCETNFDCPICTCSHSEEDWYSKYSKSKIGYIYISCKGCKRKIGVSTDITGDVKVWDKEEETI